MLFMEINYAARTRHISQHGVSQLLWLSVGLNELPMSPFCLLGMLKKCVQHSPRLPN